MHAIAKMYENEQHYYSSQVNGSPFLPRLHVVGMSSLMQPSVWYWMVILVPVTSGVLLTNSICGSVEEAVQNTEESLEQTQQRIWPTFIVIDGDSSCW